MTTAGDNQLGAVDVDDIARDQLAQRKGDLVGGFLRRTGSSDRTTSGERGTQLPHRAELGLDAPFELVSTVLKTLHPLLGPYDAGIRPKLGEREVEELTGTLRVVAPDEVRSHVVGGAESSR